MLMLAALCVGLWIGDEPPCYGVLDATIMRPSSDRLNEAFERDLPKSFEGASIALRFAGFREGNLLVGTDYRHRLVPEPDPVFENERQTVSRFNGLLREYGADLIRPFVRNVEASAISSIEATVYLLKRNDRTFAIHVERTEIGVLPSLFPSLFSSTPREAPGSTPPSASPQMRTDNNSVVSLLLVSLVVVGALVGALLWPFDEPDYTWRVRLRDLRATGVAFGLIAAFLFWTRSYWYHEVDRAFMWGLKGGSNATQVMAWVLPTNIEEAVVALRDSAFKEGSYSVGAVHHQRRVAQTNDDSELKRNGILRFNIILEDHNAVFVRPFRKDIPRMVFPEVPVRVYLLQRKDGTMAVHATGTTAIPFL